MQTSSAPHAATETDSVSFQINLLALSLAIELARAGDAEPGPSLPALAVRHLCERLGEETHQMGGGEALRRAVEELARALRHAGEVAHRPGQECPGAEPMGAQGTGRR